MKGQCRGWYRVLYSSTTNNNNIPVPKPLLPNADRDEGVTQRHDGVAANEPAALTRYQVQGRCTRCLEVCLATKTPNSLKMPLDRSSYLHVRDDPCKTFKRLQGSVPTLVIILVLQISCLSTSAYFARALFKRLLWHTLLCT